MYGAFASAAGRSVMARVEYYDDPTRAQNSIVVAASAVAVNDSGETLPQPAPAHRVQRGDRPYLW